MFQSKMNNQGRKKQDSGGRNRPGSGEIPRNFQGNQNRKNQGNVSSGGKVSFQRQTSYDNVRKIVQIEGREARNLLTWSVPVEEHGGEVKTRTSRTYDRKAMRAQSANRSHKNNNYNKHRASSPPPRKNNSKDRRSRSVSTSTPGNSISAKKGDLRARYWAFLFDNLRRAVDEIYQTCETDESVVECKEVIMMLEQCTKDFKMLIERMQILKAYENAEEGQKPASIAWELRKTSPGKSISAANKERVIPSPTVARSLNFETIKAAVQQGQIKSGTVPGNSWADKVKGIPAPVKCADLEESQFKLQSTVTEEDDDEGWATVQRGGRIKRSLSTSSHHGSHSSLGSNCGRHLQEKSTSNHSVNGEVPGSRERANSKDSEKENISSHANILKKQDSVPRNSTAKRPTDLGIPSPVDKIETLSLDTLDKLPLIESDVLSPDDKGLRDSVDSDFERKVEEELQKELDSALQAADQEEESYLSEIAREQSMDDELQDVDEDESMLGSTQTSVDSSQQTADLQKAAGEGVLLAILANLNMDSGKSWEQLMAEEEAEEINSRTPGRVVHMHEKLSSPSRKRSPTESRKKYEEKQAKAKELRIKVMQEKSERVRMLTKKVEEVRLYKEELLEEKRDMMDRKLQEAEEKRQLLMKLKVRKAHEEETKANEIAFINSLEAQNRKHDITVKHQECEARLQDIQEERQRKHEEKAAKEAAVEERRKALEADRLARLQEMQDRRKERDKKFEQRMQKKEKEKMEAIKLKEKEREERIAALNAMQAAQIEELQKRIKQKQDESNRRHKDSLQQIREKAFEMSILRHSTGDYNDAPNSVPYEKKKFCSVCNVMITSEVFLLSHLRGKRHLEALADSKKGQELSKQDIESFNLKNISDAPTDKPDPSVALEKERQKALKKRCKKLRQRMSQRGSEYENTQANKNIVADSPNKAKLQKLIRDITKHLQTPDSGPWPQNKTAALDRALGEISRIMDKRIEADKLTFRTNGGLTTLSRVMMFINTYTPGTTPTIPVKSMKHACSVLRQACEGCYDNCHYMLFSNKIGPLLDLLIHRLQILIPENFSKSYTTPHGGSFKLPHDPVSSSLLLLISTILSHLSAREVPGSKPEEGATTAQADAFNGRTNDLLSYLISVGVVDRLAVYFNSVRGAIDGDTNGAEFLHNSLALIIAASQLMAKRNHSPLDPSPRYSDDPTQLISTFRVTELVGIVSLMYGMLLHSGAPSRGDAAPPELPLDSLGVLVMGFKMLNQMALLDLTLLQDCLGMEGASLEFRHIASYLLWYCSHRANEEILHQVILCVGYFTLLNTDNQNVIQSGQAPTVLQQLCSLPFQYFSDPRLTNILFPTLIAASYDNTTNREILEQELSCALLANFMEEKILESQQTALQNSGSKNNKEKADLCSSMALRYPKEKWRETKDYFSA